MGLQMNAIRALPDVNWGPAPLRRRSQTNVSCTLVRLQSPRSSRFRAVRTGNTRPRKVRPPRRRAPPRRCRFRSVPAGRGSVAGCRTITQDQQRPAVADHFHRGVDRAARARLVWPPRHHAVYSTCGLPLPAIVRTSACKSHLLGGSWCRTPPATCRSHWTASSPGRIRAGRTPWEAGAGAARLAHRRPAGQRS